LELLNARGVDIGKREIPDNDPKTFRMLGEGKSTSIFQFESSGMQNILKRAKPASIEDLIALNALYRPGRWILSISSSIPRTQDSDKLSHPIPGKVSQRAPMASSCIRSRSCRWPGRWRGTPLGRADLLRRAMGKKKPEILAKERAPFIEGALSRGYSAAQAEEIFDN
jgi:DNA polymerase-3 subunit alpha